ncbi:MAG: hypothetical protein GY778_23890 [bacterium]|nr:hypothetical protein [bacterium]
MDVNVAVSELVTGKQMAQWCETFRVEIDAVDVAGLPLTIRSNLRRSSDHEQGQEDLMFPYGRIPGRVAPLPDTLQHVDLPSTGG